MNSLIPPFNRRSLARRQLLLMVMLAGQVALARADLIELTNGDHYRGTVLGMTLTNLDFLSEIQGRVRLPRDKVAQITLHEVVRSGAPVAAAMATNPANNSAPGNSNTAPVTSAAVLQQLRSQGVDPKIMDQIQEQIFGKANPEAAQKFNDMVTGLQSGNLSIKDIRMQAQDSIKQIREAKKELGGEAGDLLDGYLGILEKFVQETDATAGASGK